jgi:hypothetical protein
MTPPAGVIPAMPVKTIINPACARTIRRSPKRSAPDRADNAADHGANGAGYHKSGTGAESRANGIGSGTRRSSKQ